MAKRSPPKQAPEPAPVKQGGNRDTGGRFKPGQSGNPNGRPKGTTISEYLRRESEVLVGDRTKGEIVAEKAFDLAMGGDMKAIVFISERLDGKVPTRIIAEPPKPLD